MSGLYEIVRRMRETRDPSALVAAIPYSRFIGFEAELVGEELIGKMAFLPRLIGDAGIPALHGGTIGALLESTAILTVLLSAETLRVPKTIGITVDYLRSGRPADTFAVAEVSKLGRRVASVRAVAWQERRDRPIAAANAHFLMSPPEEERGRGPG